MRIRGYGGVLVVLAMATAFAWSLFASSVVADEARADVGDYRCEDASKVYFGNARLFQKPCVISSDRVYRDIPEYREIVDKGLTDKDPKYHLLMKKASERFTKAVKAAARALDHDLVAEAGAVSVVKAGASAPPIRTQEVIDRLN